MRYSKKFNLSLILSRVLATIAYTALSISWLLGIMSIVGIASMALYNVAFKSQGSTLGDQPSSTILVDTFPDPSPVNNLLHWTGGTISVLVAVGCIIGVFILPYLITRTWVKIRQYVFRKRHIANPTNYLIVIWKTVIIIMPIIGYAIVYQILELDGLLGYALSLLFGLTIVVAVAFFLIQYIVNRACRIPADKQW